MNTLIAFAVVAIFLFYVIVRDTPEKFHILQSRWSLGWLIAMAVFFVFVSLDLLALSANGSAVYILMLFPALLVFLYNIAKVLIHNGAISKP